MSKTLSRPLFGLGAVLFIALLLSAIYPKAYAASNDNVEVITKTGDFESIVIFVGTENVVVKQEGTELKIEVESGTEGSYQIRDNTNIPMEDRYFYYNKWDIIFEQENRYNTTAPYSDSITVTIPEGIYSVHLRTSSGDIQAAGLEDLRLSVESVSGNITLTESTVNYISAASRSGGVIKLEDIICPSDISINNKTYRSADYNGKYNIVLGIDK